MIWYYLDVGRCADCRRLYGHQFHTARHRDTGGVLKVVFYVLACVQVCATGCNPIEKHTGEDMFRPTCYLWPFCWGCEDGGGVSLLCRRPLVFHSDYSTPNHALISCHVLDRHVIGRLLLIVVCWPTRVITRVGCMSTNRLLLSYHRRLT